MAFFRPFAANRRKNEMAQSSHHTGRIITDRKWLGINFENEVKFQLHGPFELISYFFIGLLKTM